MTPRERRMILSRHRVSQDPKVSTQNRKRTLEVVKMDDGTFDLFLNHTLDRRGITEQWLPEELCVRFGFCGEEYRSILCELKQKRRITLLF